MEKFFFTCLTLVVEVDGATDEVTTSPPKLVVVVEDCVGEAAEAEGEGGGGGFGGGTTTATPAKRCRPSSVSRMLLGARTGSLHVGYIMTVNNKQCNCCFYPSFVPHTGLH